MVDKVADYLNGEFTGKDTLIVIRYSNGRVYHENWKSKYEILIKFNL